MSQQSSKPVFGISRRQFVSSAAAVSAFSVIPRHVLGGPGQTSPSDRPNIAGVGIGGKGYSDLTSVEGMANIVALCDVDTRKATGAFNRYSKAKRYQDYRIMLDKEDKNIDGVIIATPDHTHAIVSIAAMKRGKHVYTQKPLAHSVYEAREMTRAARKYKVATQMGNQGQAGDGPRRLREMIWDGAIGPVREVHVWTDRPNRGVLGVYWPQGIDRPKDTPAVPDYIDWDLFLGPAPYRPYHPAYHPFAWRGWWDFGTGALGDIGCHTIDPVFRALKLEAPLTVQAVSTIVNKETYPSGSIVKYEFPARGDMCPVSLTWYDGGLKPNRPDELEDGLMMGTNGTLYVGDKGKILDGRIIPEEKRKAYKLPEKSIPSSPGHYAEWINACKGGDPAGSNFDWAGPLAETVLLGNICLRMEMKDKMNRFKFNWDSEQLKITNVPEANQFLHTEYREGWSL